MGDILPDQQEAMSKDQWHHVILGEYKRKCSPVKQTSCTPISGHIFQTNHPMIIYADDASVTEKGKYTRSNTDGSIPTTDT